jgi:hypothetical protein
MENLLFLDDVTSSFYEKYKVLATPSEQELEYCYYFNLYLGLFDFLEEENWYLLLAEVKDELQHTKTRYKLTAEFVFNCIPKNDDYYLIRKKENKQLEVFIDELSLYFDNLNFKNIRESKPIIPFKTFHKLIRGLEYLYRIGKQKEGSVKLQMIRDIDCCLWELNQIKVNEYV